MDWIENVDEARLEEMEGGDDHTGNEDDDLPDIPLKKPKLDLWFFSPMILLSELKCLLLSEMAINIFNEILKCLDDLNSGEGCFRQNDLEEGTLKEGNLI